MSKEGGERRQLAKTCEIRQMTPLSTTQEWRNKSQGVTESKEEKSDNLKAESSQFVEMNSGENRYYTFVNMINGNTTGLSAEV